MTESKRNVAVGLTVLIALSGLAYLILLFGKLPAGLKGGYKIYMEFPSSGGVTEGTDVHLNGVTVGKITGLGFQSDPRKGVVFTAIINSGMKLPGDVNPYIYTKGFVGGAWIELSSDNQAPGNERHMEWIPAGYTLTGGKYKGSGIIPDELMTKVDQITASFNALGELSSNLNKLITPMVAQGAPTPTSGPTTETASAPSTQTAGMQGTIARLNKTLDSFNAVFGDVESQQNVKATLANLRVASEQGIKAMQELKQFAGEARESLKGVDSASSTMKTRVDELGGKLVLQADNLGKLLTTLNQVAYKIEQGQGSAGLLLNDPKLYNNLVGASGQLTATLQDLQAMIQLWKTEGATIKMK